jgi:beta-aspartyl-peptidase (threonine type)
LCDGATAEIAVESAIRLLEDDEHFDAGRGSHLKLDGAVELDAGFMEGAQLRLGAVAGVRDILNPISLARLLMDDPDYAFLIGEGASRYAEAHGMSRCDPRDLVVEREVRAWQMYLAKKAPAAPGGDTVGAIALDRTGHIAVGVSTGGRQFAMPGRVGDVPCVGSGFYADDAIGAAACTGVGEQIMRLVLAKHVVDTLARGRSPTAASQAAIEHLARRVDGRAGVIGLDRHGRTGWAYNTLRMARAWFDGHAVVSLVDRRD